MKAFRRLLPYLVFALFLVGGLTLWLQRVPLQDWWVLRAYNPPPAIEQLVDDTAMTPRAQRLFYVNHPTLDDKDTFNVNCAGIIAEAAVLGCYRGDRQGIHIYHVTDERLYGIEQVTAAHEMLHQAYDRLSHSERDRINLLLEQFLEDGLQDDSIREKLDLYRREGVKTVVNEMHSIFGSEVANLSPELEEYYKRYFTDRSHVVAFREQSRAAFAEYRGQIVAYDSQLQDLKQRIAANELLLATRLTELTARRDQLDRDLAADRVEQYNAGVPEFNSMVAAYNSLLATTKSLVDQYNRLVEERNAVAIQVTDLNAALDSRLTPQ